MIDMERLGSSTKSQGGGNPYQNMAFGDIFEHIFRQKFHFGGNGFWDDEGGMGNGGGSRKGPPAKLDIQVNLNDMYNGVSGYRVTLSRRKICPKCKGLGAKDARDVATCPECRGAGVRIFQQHVGMGMIQQFQAPCQRCAASGKIFKTVCGTCSGQKIVVGEDVVTLALLPVLQRDFERKWRG